MDIRQLTYFITVAETKSYSLAATNLFVTQPTISQSVKKLESELNTQLFYQNGRELFLTNSGQILYQKGKLIVKDVNNLIEEIQELGQPKKEVLKVGITQLIAIQFMPEIASFISNHPNVELVLREEGSRKIQSLLKEEKLDIGILSFPSVDDSIVIEPLLTSTKGYYLSFVMHKKHPLSTSPFLTFNDLRDVNFSSLGNDYMITDLLMKKCRSIGFEPNIIFQHNDWGILIHSLSSLNSVTLLPSEFKNYSNNPDLVWIPLDDKNAFFPIGIASLKEHKPTSTINAFLSAIKSN
ncbi:LysR family transcriptional regulator [Streptococcus thoraltensis]|uniref:LysR family transcriptional regulator n=1 Tax=Streptococcus thoraltensis TaxID=55085 RepID=UPI0003699F70|nr:LysR family transcriptional regulator [Streptococcus thoraltensis]MDY4761607.1 LysR family transcriptional regulator [Streptococcus thoraltensis]